MSNLPSPEQAYRDAWHAQEAEAAALAEAEAPPAEPEPPPPPPLRRSVRKPGDAATRLGFSVGECAQDVRCSSLWVWHAWNLPQPAVVGAIESSISLPYKTVVAVRIFDAHGNLELSADLQFVNVGLVKSRFDEVRLSAGDKLILFNVGSGGGATAQGTYPAKMVGTFSKHVPEKPILDQLLANRSSVDDFPIDFGTYSSGGSKTGVPQFRFFAE